MSSYRDAGVDIDAGNRTVDLIRGVVASTATDAVLSEVGAFGGLFAADDLGPGKILVASTDGVGTKVELAARHGRWGGLGHDLVNHCVNDILVQGARPLFFLDYVATAELVPEVVAEIVTGLASACRDVGCALLGGETAEMPGVYVPGALDLAGTIVGVVDRASLLPRLDELNPGDRLVGLPGDGPHTNGYSLIRRLIEGREVDDAMIDWLLQPHRCYAPVVAELLGRGIRPKALVHVTGGGFPENIPRVLPPDLGARVDMGSWPVPEEFATLVEWGSVTDTEAFRVWNMGIGMIVVVDEGDATRAGYPVIGEVVAGGAERVVLTGSWR
jgi:phosphoribosylformylglycinamidine cyclo-ligase